MFQRAWTSSINRAVPSINYNAEAWHIVKTLDPLMDSDDEDITDYNMHVDIGEHLHRCWATRVCSSFFLRGSARRLEVISRIRTRPATPL